MKISRTYCYLMIFAAFTSLSSCEKEEELYPQLGEDPRTLKEIISETPEISAFSQTMAQVDLDSLLGTTSTYTVFAPHNTVLDAIDPSAMSQAEYENLLLNHVVPTVTADFTSTLETGYVPTMATGPDEQFLDLFLNAEVELTVNGTAALVEGAYDLGGTNGVLHVVDAILTPPTVVDHLEANPVFSIFTEAVELAGLTETLQAMEVTNPEVPEYPLTVFAPTNAAFENLLTKLNGAFGWATLDDIPVDVLKEIIMHHIIKGSNSLAAQIPGTEQTTSQGEVLVINSEGIIADASYTATNISIGDIQAINGVIHAVDKVLLTENVFQDLLGATLNLVERNGDKGFSTFLAAAEKVGLTETLATDELTLFVPNNAAFDVFFSTITNFESLADFDTPEELELLKNVLEYHLHEGTLLSSEMSDGNLSTLRDDELIVDTSTGSLTPSHEHAPNANFVSTNIGAINGVVHEIGNVLVSDIDAGALGYPAPETGAPVFALPVYYDTVESGFLDTWGGWGGTWTWNSTEIVQSGSTSIKLEYTEGSYGAIQIASSAPIPDISSYSTFHFYAYGAPGTGSTTIFVSLCDCDAGVEVVVAEGEWTRYTLPISNFSDTSLSAIRFKNNEAASSTIYIDDIGFDIQDTAASVFN